MKPAFRQLLFAALISWGCGSCLGGQPPWLEGSVLSAAHPPVMSGHAVFKSLDNGLTWTSASHGLSVDNRVNALLILESGALAGMDRGMFRSSDARHWTPVRSGVPEGVRVQRLLAHGDKVFAGTVEHGVLVSADSGITWSRSAGGLRDANIRSLATDGRRVFAGSDGGTVWVTEDQGASWRAAGAGLPEHAQVFDLVVSGGEVFAGLYSKGLYRLDEAAQRWVKAGEVSPLQLAATTTTLFAGHNPGGVWTRRQPDPGWRENSLGLPANAPVWVLASGGESVYLGTIGDGGLYVSNDEGATWSRRDTGLPERSSTVSLAVGRDYLLAGIVGSSPP